MVSSTVNPGQTHHGRYGDLLRSESITLYVGVERMVATLSRMRLAAGVSTPVLTLRGSVGEKTDRAPA